MRRTSRNKRRTRGAGGRVSFFAAGGVLTVILLVLFLVSFEKRSEGTGALNFKKLSSSPNPSVKIATEKSKTPVIPRFTFYETLTRLEPGSFLPDDFKVDPITPPQEKHRKPNRAVSSKGSFTIQVAALATQAAAETLSKQLRRKGYRVQIHSLAVPNRGTLFRVRVGSFETREEAELQSGKIKREEGLSPFITSSGR